MFRRTIASSVVALLAALAIVVFVLGRGPGSLVWFAGSSPTWLPFAGSGLSWLPFGQQTPPPGPAATPPAQLPATSPSPAVSPSPSPSPSPSATPSPSPAATPTPTATPLPAPAPTPVPTPTPTPVPPGPLAASASAAPSQGQAPLSVTFSGSASGGSGSYTYYWDFGDQTMGTGPSPQHVYALLGVYTAVLTVDDTAAGVATSTVLVQVSMGTTISATPASGFAPLNVSLDGSAAGGTTPYSYSWDFGDGSTAGPLTAAAQAHAYSLPGTFTAKLTVTDAKLVTASDTVAITVRQPVPTVGGISPNSGPETGTTAVTITGTYFMNLSAVKFGSTYVAPADLGAPSCDAFGACTVIVNSPARPAGPSDVRVLTAGGISPIGNDQFTYYLAWAAVVATKPSAREGAAMVNDGSGVLLFGGFSGATLLNDTWYWNGTAWLHVTTPPGATPAARVNAAIAYSGSKVVLFGGACGLPAATSTCDLNDTWTWDPKTQSWAAVQADTATPGTGQPSRRAGAQLAKDSSGKLILFGGDAAGTYLNDSWTFAGSGWTLKTTVTAPTVRAFGSMATDASGQVVLFGGYNGSAVLGDTWIWSGSSGWRSVNTLAAPSARQLAALAYFYKPNGGTASGLAIFGGRDGSGDLGDTWTWNGSSWIPLYAAGPGMPSSRSEAMAAIDTNGSVILFAGTSSGTQLNDLWRLS